eukprot:235814-Amphidinium_carterae.1
MQHVLFGCSVSCNTYEAKHNHTAVTDAPLTRARMQEKSAAGWDRQVLQHYMRSTTRHLRLDVESQMVSNLVDG